MKTYERTPEVGSVNLLFDQAMYSLHDDLARIVEVLGASGVPYELVGGVGVLAHILRRDPSRSLSVAPEWMQFFEMHVPVAPLVDLVRMKLTSFRAKDQPHLELLDETGLITETLELQLPEVLRERLAQARAQWLAEKPDVEN